MVDYKRFSVFRVEH